MKRCNELEKAKDVSVLPGNAGYNEYMRGMANGLILAVAIIEAKEPKYIDPPAAAKTLDRETVKRAINALGWDARMNMADDALADFLFNKASVILKDTAASAKARGAHA